MQTTGHFANPSNVTLAAWVNLTTADTSGAEVISLGDSVALRLDQSGVLAGSIYNGTTWVTTNYTVTLAGTGWHHVAYTFNNTGNLATLYLDGASVATTSTTASITYTLGANSFIGKHGDGNTAMDFTGKIDDARIYSRVLTAAEIATLADDLSMTDTDSVSVSVLAIPGTVQYGTSTSGSANSATSITLASFTATAGASRIIVVGLAFGLGAPTGVSVTYGGRVLTLASGTTGTNGNAHVQIWYLTDPNTGPFDIVASWTGARDVVIGAAQFANVNQSTPITNGTFATGTSTAPSVTVTSATGKMTFNTVSTLGTLSAPTKTQRWLVTTPTTMDGGGSTAAGAPTVTHAWTSTSAAWAAAGVTINAISTSDFQVGTFTKSSTSLTGVSYQNAATGSSASAATITLTAFNPRQRLEPAPRRRPVNVRQCTSRPDCGLWRRGAYARVRHVGDEPRHSAYRDLVSGEPVEHAGQYRRLVDGRAPGRYWRGRVQQRRPDHADRERDLRHGGLQPGLGDDHERHQRYDVRHHHQYHLGVVRADADVALERLQSLVFRRGRQHGERGGDGDASVD